MFMKSILLIVLGPILMGQSQKQLTDLQRQREEHNKAAVAWGNATKTHREAANKRHSDRVAEEKACTAKGGAYEPNMAHGKYECTK